MIFRCELLSIQGKFTHHRSVEFRFQDLIFGSKWYLHVTVVQCEYLIQLLIGPFNIPYVGYSLWQKTCLVGEHRSIIYELKLVIRVNLNYLVSLSYLELQLSNYILKFLILIE